MLLGARKQLFRRLTANTSNVPVSPTGLAHLLLEDQLVLELERESRVSDGDFLAIRDKLPQLLGKVGSSLLLQAWGRLIVQGLLFAADARFLELPVDS